MSGQAPSRTLGKDVLAEIKARGQWGNFFSFEQYQQLKGISTEGEFEDFASSCGYGELGNVRSPREIVDRLEDIEFSRGTESMAVRSFDFLFTHPLISLSHILLLALARVARRRYLRRERSDRVENRAGAGNAEQ